MESEDVMKIAEVILESDGIFDYEIHTTSKVEGSNFWTVVTKSGDSELTLLIDDNGGKLLDMQKSRHLVRVLNENVEVSDSISISVGRFFEFSEPVWFPNNIINSSKIEIQRDSSDSNKISAFVIHTDGTEEQNIDAIKTALRIVNYLSLKTGLFIHHKHPKILVDGKIQPESRGTGIGTCLTNLHDLDFQNQNFVDLISNDSKNNQLMAHFAAGQRALDDNIYDQAIREFFIVIENNGSVEEAKYKPLRHAVSHDKLDDSIAVQNLNQDFGITMQVGSYLDITDPEVQGILKEEAKNLRQIAIQFVEIEINL